MIRSQEIALAHELTGRADGNDVRFEITLPLRSRPQSGTLNNPTVLVASSDEKVLQTLAEIVVQCGLATFLAFSVYESSRLLKHREVCLVVCDDRLIDGKYDDILNETVEFLLKTPVIVVSPTGDWPDYLKAMNAGAFDYLTYPPIPGDLPRSIYNALTFRAARHYQEIATKIFNSSGEGIL